MKQFLQPPKEEPRNKSRFATQLGTNNCFYVYFLRERRICHSSKFYLTYKNTQNYTFFDN